MERKNRNDGHASLSRVWSILLGIGLVAAGCASSGDVEQVRQEREQAKAKMSAELQQERQLAQSMEKESEARKAEADKLAKALGGGAAAKAMVPRQTAGMTLTAALQNSNCLDKIAAQSPNPAVPQALFIGGTLPTKGGNSACTSVTISTTDTTPFSAASPLIPVVVGSGGTLTLVDPGAGSRLTLYASSLLIKNSGTMQAGTASNPVQGQITIAMAGNQSAALAPSATGGASIVTTSNNAPNARDITVMDGGTLALYGAKGLSATPGTLNKDIVSGTKSWTYLAVPAGPAKYNDAENVSAPVPATNPDTTLTLATQVDWQINNWVSVATTSFSSHQTEIVQICGISSVANPDPQASTLGLPANVSQVTLCSTTPLKHYHYGGLTPTPGFFPAGTKQVVAKGGNAIDVGRQAKSFYDDHTRNYGIDERAEVALLSRNIKLTSVAGSAGDQQLFQNTATYPLSYDMGGHVVAMVTGTTYPTLQLVGVEIEKFGQGLTGRYPVHLHMLQNLPAGNVLVQDVSVHHSYNKCYVPHQTPNAQFYNNVCVRTVGQGFYLEDGNHITGNQFMRNHVAGTMAALSTYSFPQQNGSQYWDGDNLQVQHSHVQSGSITGATNASPIVVTTSAPVPSNGMQVTVAGVLGNTAANGTWPVSSTNPSAGTFALQGSTGNGTFVQPAGAWTIGGLNAITGIVLDSGNLLAIQTQSTPVTGTQVTISGTGTAADGTWTITNVISGPPRFSLVGSKGKSPGTYSCCNGTWTASGTVTDATNRSPIVITSSSSLNSGAKVTISGVQGNTAANGTWTVTNIDATHFSLQSSTGNGNYPKPTWADTNPSPNWYNVNNIPDTAQSNANGNTLDSTHPGGFWITNLGNAFVNNSVAGCQGPGRGYWLLAQGPTTTGYPEFTGNRVHGCYNGIDNDDTTGNTVQPYPMLSSTAQYAPVLLLTDNTITRSRNKAAWFRNWYATLHNHRFATNLRGFSLLVGGGPEGTFPGFWGLVYQNVIAGMTRNNVERYPACSSAGWQPECTDVGNFSFENYPAHNVNIQGYSYYDGPARIEHNRFVNFRFDPTGIHATDRAARLLTKTDIQHIATTAGMVGQLQGIVTQAAANAAPSSNYQGYPGDVANGWQTSNAQTVPPTQYIRDSIWDNVDFKHQVYTEAVNMGPFLDGDKTTVIRDLDSHLTGLRVVDGGGNSHHDIVPISLNSVDYFATEYTVDEPHSRGPNDFRSTSLMSPHKYATLNVESVTSPAGGIPTPFHVVARRDMPAYGDTVYPSLFLYGRGKNPIYEPFVMDRMGYTVYGVQGVEHYPPYTPTAFQNRLLFSYTDPPVHKAGDYFVNRIAVYQPVTTPSNIKVYRISRQWGGQLYGTAQYPPSFHPPVGASCDHTFFDRQSEKEAKWTDCMKRALNQGGYSGGMTIPAATSLQQFEQPYKTLMGVTNPQPSDITNFINAQTYYYDTTNNLLYFYMIEDKPVQKQYSPYGTCHAAKYSDYVTQIQGIKSFSDPNSVQAALDASCLVSGGTPQPNDLFVCHETGCTAYLVDLSAATITTPGAPPATPPHPITRKDYKAWNQYHFVYGTPAQEPNGVPVPTTAPQDGTPLPAFLAPTDGLPPNQGGNQITYDFYPLSGGPNSGQPFPVTENFRYHCVTAPPWAPVNARGAYPPSGGFTYPLSPSVCMTAAQGTAVMETGVVLQVVVTNPGSGYTSPPTVTITPPAGGMQAQGVATIANGSVTGVTMTNQGSGYNFGPQVTFAPPSP
ncbi:MAG: hypothetical protein KGI53_07320 [Nitrospirota bacterium]|nr:hypothetical protein [Nitrospirota bacterium]